MQYILIINYKDGTSQEVPLLCRPSEGEKLLKDLSCILDCSAISSYTVVSKIEKVAAEIAKESISFEVL